MRRLLIGAVIVAAALASASAYAVDPAAGQKQFEATCAACHGSNGISVAPIYPDLAGQKDQYLVSQLKAFRDGSRKNAIMEPMAKHLTDAQIVDLAAFLSALHPSGH
ncbi:MAG TPA: cytochrome c [Nevskiaceae bacterium]|nr:cytochrome c [Nevskiaceae bacterium]